MGLSSPGIGSGLDIKTIVDAIVKAEITPLKTRHDKQVNNVNTEISAVGQLKTALENLQTSLTNLSDPTKFHNMKYTLSTPGYLTPTLTANAVKGTYQIEVQKLAQQQCLASTYFPTKESTVGSGSLTINFGTYNSDKSTFTPNSDATALTLTIAPDKNTLSDICDAINNSDSDVTAHIVQDDQGSRITISSAKTGTNYEMQITGDLSAINYDPTHGVNALTETIAAQNSTVLINGLTLNQSTNTLENAIDGVTLNLTKAELGTKISLTIDDNKDQLTNLVYDFVNKYNASMTLLINLTGFNAATKQSGVYQSDPQLRNLKYNLSQWATLPVADDDSAVRALSDLGITTDRQGLLQINKETFNTAITKNYADVGNLFAKSDGLAAKMTHFLDTYMDSKTGDLTQRSTQLTRRMSALNREQDQINLRTEKIQARYLAQYTALDEILTRMQSVSSTLTQQLSALPNFNRSN